MGRSFYYGTDTAVRDGALVLARKIVASPEAYGLSQAMADEYASIAQAYDEALRRALAPATRTRGAVCTKSERKLALRKATGEVARIIEARGVSTSQRLELGLSPRDTTRPPQRPGTPFGFAVTLDAIGTLTLSWRCKHPTRCVGTLYQVWRCVGEPSDQAAFAYLGHSGTKRYCDTTVPPGASCIVYRVQAVRSTGDGTPAEHPVTIGVTPDVQAMLRSTERFARAA